MKTKKTKVSDIIGSVTATTALGVLLVALSSAIDSNVGRVCTVLFSVALGMIAGRVPGALVGVVAGVLLIAFSQVLLANALVIVGFIVGCGLLGLWMVCRTERIERAVDADRYADVKNRWTEESLC